MVFSIYFIVVLFFYYKIIQQYSEKLWRNKVFVLFSIYFIFAVFISIFSASMDIFNTSGNRVLLIITMLNLYVYYLQYMYSPSPEGIEEA